MWMCLGVGFIVIVIYKFMDFLLRIPKRNSPSGNCKFVLVTGCDTGFGNLFSKRLDGKGFTVFAACLTEKGKEDLEKTCQNVKAFTMNISDEGSVAQGLKFVKKTIGDREGLWAIVNNAGIVGSPGVTDWLERKHYQDVLDVNLYGMISVVKTFLPLVKRIGGRIVNTASVVGRLALPGSAPYMISKYAVEGYCDILRREMRSFGVSVHTIEPGFYKTNMSRPEAVVAAAGQLWEKLPEHTKQEYGEDYFKQAVDIMENTLPMIASVGLYRVVDAYEHAVLGYFPRSRYMPGWDARFLYWPLSLLPEWISDPVLMATMPIPQAVKK